jgi:endonuclease/exonuclease/phosphatase family metal-dependent hydrolase
MRLASYNVENLFDRPKAMNLADKAAGSALLDAHGELTVLLEQATYTPAAKTRIVELLGTLGLADSDAAEFFMLRRIRGRLLRRPQAGATEVVANGRADWIGWVEPTTDRVAEVAIANTGRVIRDVGADVLAVVEADNRIALKRFTDPLLRDPAGALLYPHVMLVDGNDDRGIDVGLLTGPAFPIMGIRSHVDDTDADGEVFSRDCPEYRIEFPGAGHLVVLVNHFKSKLGTQQAANAKRRRQAIRTADIYRRLRADSEELVALVGDLNDTPDSPPLQPLLADTDLRDITTHPNFTSDGRPGTFGSGNASDKIDYILLSPALFDRVTGGAIERRGVWAGTHGTIFPHYDTITAEHEAASDHAALYADLDL